MSTQVLPQALYQYEEKLRTHDTQIVSVTPLLQLSDEDRALFESASPDDVAIAVTSTIFFAQGGGQPSDTGTMTYSSSSTTSIFNVTIVRKSPSGFHLHLGNFSSPDAVHFKPGDTVHQAIDGAKRDLHSRVHDAGHILSLAVGRMTNFAPDVTELKASHHPDAAFVEFKGYIGGTIEYNLMDYCREIVAAELPVKVHWWEEKELRKQCVFVPEVMDFGGEGGLFRAVDIEGAGAYPCGGTHVENTGFVGTIIVRNITHAKGASKIWYGVYDWSDWK
ncbi:ThrRS/AlaRS common domain-containing protein [Viridothelium virens]|uniref:ThrRS/AlaRS common domain-containing protein n=1 Tax=Viridothelium virens TaxID=1048519 RepID=A0A6A6HGC6_VIRVR|nr:ThrRS/AlaRS common domain-containing protein [Viridothelium virens]